MHIEKYERMTRFVIVFFIFLLFAGIQSTDAVAVVVELDYDHSFTVKDYYDNDAVTFDDTDDDTGFWGVMNYNTAGNPPYISEHFFEFDISGTASASSATLDIDLYNFVSAGDHINDYKDIKLAYYVGAGITDISLFGTYDGLLGTHTLDLWGDNAVSVDVTSIYNTYKGSGHDYLGFRLYEPRWNDDQTGSEVEFMDSKLSVNVVPEPISSALFVVGGTLLIGRRYIKKKRTA